MHYLEWTNTISIIMIFSGHIWIVVLAFNRSFGWGFCCLVFGWIGPLLYSIEYWKQVAIPLTILYLGTAIFAFNMIFFSDCEKRDALNILTL